MARNQNGNRWSWLSAESFLHGIGSIETIVSKLLSIAMLIVMPDPTPTFGLGKL